MMNNDRISEVYKGELWPAEKQARARRRIHWLCAQARGDRVLDLGCSQGICTILLAREGFTVTGVDVEEPAILYAQRDLAREAEPVQQRATFVLGEGADLPFEDDEFDTILMGELLEHLVLPDRVLTEAARVLRPGGRIVITTPFGLSPHHDHKQTYFGSELLEMVSEHFGIVDADIAELYIRLVAEPRDRGSSGGLDFRDLATPIAATTKSLQQELIDHRSELTQARRRLAENVDQVKALKNTVRKLEQDASSSRVEQQRERERLTNYILKVQSKLSTAMNEGRQQTARAVTADRRARKRIQKLTLEKAKLEYERDVLRWRLGSMRQRRWWRLGATLGSVRRRPWAVVGAFVAVLRIFFGPSVPVSPRPKRPRQRSDSASEASSGVQRAARRGAQAPRRAVPVATILTEHDEYLFSYEWVHLPLSLDDYARSLEEERPELLFVARDAWDALCQSRGSEAAIRLVDAVRAANVPTVLWDTDTEPLALESSLGRLFDLILCAPEAEATYAKATAVSSVGFDSPAVQVRIVNPTGAVARTKDVLVLPHAPDGFPRVKPGFLTRLADRYENSVLMDVLCTENAAGGNEAATRIPRSDAVSALAKQHELAVVDLTQPATSTQLRIIGEVAASGTPVLASGEVPTTLDGIVIPISEERGGNDAIRSLLGSDELRDRLGHRAARKVVAARALSRSVDTALTLTGLAQPPESPLLSLMIPTNRPWQLEAAIDNVARQSYPRVQLVLATHGLELDTDYVVDLATSKGVEDIKLVPVDERVALGDVFNRGFAECEGEFVGKMDDDDYYGADYASDLVDAFCYSSADIVGKWTHYAYSEALDITVLRYPGREHTYQELLAISTLIMRRNVIDEVSFLPMPRGSGSQFLREAASLGATVYSGDRFNYLYIRYSGNGHRHTWNFSDFELTARSQVICKGRNSAAVEA